MQAEVGRAAPGHGKDELTHRFIVTFEAFDPSPYISRLQTPRRAYMIALAMQRISAPVELRYDAKGCETPMVKRLNSGSDDELLPKRQRPSTPDPANAIGNAFNLRMLPPELQEEIYLDATLYNGDPISFAEQLVRVKQVDRQFNAQVERDYHKNPSLEGVVNTVRYAQKRIEKFTSTLELHPDHKDAYLLPILSKERRKEVVSKLFVRNLDGISTGLGAALAKNVAYLDPDKKPVLVQYILKHLNNKSWYSNPLLEASGNIEHFNPGEVKSLLNAALNERDEGCRVRILLNFSKKANLLDEDDQVRLSTVLGDPRARMNCLAAHAESLDKLKPAAVAIVANQILQLDDEDLMKPRAMAVLARKFDHLGELEQPSVASWIVSKLEGGISPDSEGMLDFTDLGLVEAGHQMSLRKEQLPHSERLVLEGFIKGAVQAPEGENLPCKAILLTHLGKDERSKFVENSLNSDNRQLAENVAIALISAVPDMSPEEGKIYCGHLGTAWDVPNTYEIQDAIIGRHLGNLTPDSREKLIGHHLSDALNAEDDENKRLSCLTNLTGKEVLLPVSCMTMIIDSTKTSVDDLIRRPASRDSDQTRAIIHAGIAASLVANWADQHLVIISRARERSHVPGDHIQPNSCPTSLKYDERVREAR